MVSFLRKYLRAGLKGGLAGAIAGGIPGGFGSQWNMNKVVATGIGGGTSSEIMGGQFKDGFKVAFVTAAAAYLYQSTVNYRATWKSGGKVVEKRLIKMF